LPTKENKLPFAENKQKFAFLLFVSSVFCICIYCNGSIYI
jgi:hypothetical protein